jgi:hypothetical protein
MPAARQRLTVPLSVVIASHNAAAVIGTCLHALHTQDPSVRLLQFDQPLSVAVLRGRGIAAANGGIIAILDPYSVPARDWALQVLQVHQSRQNRVIGGSVDLYQAAAASHTRWTTYLNEYGLFMPPVTRGATWILPGSNVSYKRAALYDGATPRYPIFWKTFVNWAEETSGSPLWLDPDVRIELNKPIGYWAFLRSRHDHGRCFAGMRTADQSLGTRLMRAGSTVLVPLLQVWRWTAGFWPKRRHRGRYVATLPAQLLLFVMWSIGEAWGYLRGTGRACERTYY